MFSFKQFVIEDDRSTMKVSTDSVILGAWANVGAAKRILDVGTGCGVLALMCAQRSCACITGIDIHLPSIVQANENFRKSPWDDRLQAKHTALEDYKDESFDYIITNPPFFINSLKVKNPTRNLARHADEFQHQLLLFHCKKLLSQIGTLGILLPAFEAQRFDKKAIHYGFFPKRKLFVSSREESDFYIVAIEYSFYEEPCLSESLIIYANETNAYTSEYCWLTKEFYLNF